MLASLTNVEWAYLAGFIDGEGSIVDRIRPSGKHHPTIAIYQKDEEVLVWVQEHYGGSIYQSNGSACLQITAKANVGEILLGIQPYARVKRQQIRLALLMLEEPSSAGIYGAQIRALQSYSRVRL